jgi:hypothetical protein
VTNGDVLSSDGLVRVEVKTSADGSKVRKTTSSFEVPASSDSVRPRRRADSSPLPFITPGHDGLAAGP